MSDVRKAIRASLAHPFSDLEEVDPHAVARLLQPHFPQFSIAELLREVTEIAVQEGCRYLVWEPPERDAGSRD